MRLELRCCCNPNKLFGTIEVPDYQCHPDRDVNFRMRTIAPMVTMDSPIETEIKLIRLTVRLLKLPMQPSRLAVASNDTPLEILERLPGFLPVGKS